MVICPEWIMTPHCTGWRMGTDLANYLGPIKLQSVAMWVAVLLFGLFIIVFVLRDKDPPSPA